MFSKPGNGLLQQQYTHRSRLQQHHWVVWRFGHDSDPPLACRYRAQVRIALQVGLDQSDRHGARLRNSKKNRTGAHNFQKALRLWTAEEKAVVGILAL